MLKRALLLLFAVNVLISCSSSRSAAYGVYDRKAVACYYSDKFKGRLTANGDRFSNNRYTAAHKKLPFGTKVRVTNMANNKSVIVIINDRGPFSGGLDIDLSKKAFFEITDNRNHGRLNVRLEIEK